MQAVLAQKYHHVQEIQTPANCVQAWVAAHVTLAIAVRMMGEGLRYVSSTRGAAGLMQSIINEAHKQLIEVHEYPTSL